MKILVAGAGGFLGRHLVERLDSRIDEVRAISRRDADLSDPGVCRGVTNGVSVIFDMAALIGGIGFLESRHADCTASVNVTSNLLQAAVANGCQRYVFPSSACVYPDTGDPYAPALKESDVRPYAPRGGYGWTKLFTEQMLGFYQHQYGLRVGVARLGTIYGPGSPIGENEKAPIAICRKVITALREGSNEIRIWGDGEQTRSFLYIDDCIDALVRLMDSDYSQPINVGSEERVSINQLVDMVEDIAGVKLHRRYELEKPQGVRGRVCDTSLAWQVLGWREKTSLLEGLKKTYRWVEQSL